MPDTDKTLTTTDSLTAALVGLAAFLPGKAGPVVGGMLAPFISKGLIWFVSEWAKNWLEEWKAEAPTRRGERYLRQMKRKQRKMKPNHPEQAAIASRIKELEARVHSHKLSQLRLEPPPQGN